MTTTRETITVSFPPMLGTEEGDVAGYLGMTFPAFLGLPDGGTATAVVNPREEDIANAIARTVAEHPDWLAPGDVFYEGDGYILCCDRDDATGKFYLATTKSFIAGTALPALTPIQSVTLITDNRTTIGEFFRAADVEAARTEFEELVSTQRAREIIETVRDANTTYNAGKPEHFCDRCADTYVGYPSASRVNANESICPVCAISEIGVRV